MNIHSQPPTLSCLSYVKTSPVLRQRTTSNKPYHDTSHIYYNQIIELVNILLESHETTKIDVRASPKQAASSGTFGHKRAFQLALLSCHPQLFCLNMLHLVSNQPNANNLPTNKQEK